MYQQREHSPRRAVKRDGPKAERTARVAHCLALAPTSVTATESLGNWLDDFEWSWRKSIEPEQKKWRARRREAWRRRQHDKHDYAKARERSLMVDPVSRLTKCGEFALWVKCGCRRVRVEVGCRQKWLCEPCRKRYYSRMRRRVLKAAGALTARAPAGWSWVMLRLSVRHSGDVAADRARLTLGWKRLRQWAHKRIGKFAFHAVHEVTPGRDGAGHHHAHVIALWPTTKRAGSMWWGDVRSEWQRAVQDPGAELDLQVARKGVRGAAHYAAKYASKGVDVGDFPPVLAGHVIASNYGKRCQSASVGFFRAVAPEPCKCCGDLFALESRPEPLRSVAPDLIWYGLRGGIRAGPEQKCFPLEPSPQKTALYF